MPGFILPLRLLSRGDQTQGVNSQVSQVPESEPLTCPDTEVLGWVMFAVADVVYLPTVFTTALAAGSFRRPLGLGEATAGCWVPGPEPASFRFRIISLPTEKQSFLSEGALLWIRKLGFVNIKVVEA